jgi:sugar/nucleoside kinase (ribokinase family)
MLFEPTSTVKCESIVHAAPVSVITPNEYELRAMHAALVKHSSTAGQRGIPDSDTDTVSVLAKDMLTRGWVSDAVIITQGSQGVTWVSRGKSPQAGKPNTHGTDSDICTGHVPAASIHQAQIVNSTGAGDTFAGAMAYAWLMGANWEGCVHLGQEAAVLTLHSDRAVSRDLGYLGGVL